MGIWVKKNYNNVYILSFIIPTIIMVGVWIMLGIGVFGNRSLLLVDGLHQYLPFFSEYYNKLTEGKSLLYSWNIGMGNDFITLWAYYLSSPINLIVLLFKKETLYVGVSLVASIKIILSSVTFCTYLVKKRNGRKHDISIVAFSLAYAFSNYVIGYYWNVMWMDCILIFPIIILGLEKLIDEDKPITYMLAMFYSFWCNYYISFIICIFVIMWYLAYNHKSIKTFFVQGFKFAFCSILSAMMAAVVLMPSYLGITDTASAKLTWPDMKVFYGSFVDILQTHMYLIKPIKNQVFDGGTNIYCGISVILLVILALFAKKISIGKKIKYSIMLVFLVVSFNNEFLNYIWHGFHNQYGIPNRFSFVYIFTLLVIGYEIFAHIDLVKKEWVMLSYVAIMAFIILATTNDNKLEIWVYIVTAFILSIYFIVMMTYKLEYMNRKVFTIIMSSVMMVEIIVNAYIGYGNNGSVDATKYFYDTENFTEATDYLHDVDDGFYRVDLLKSLMLDEATWHNLKSIGIFGSTVQGDMVRTMNKLGFYTGANEYLYKGSTPLTNAMFGVKYVLGRPGDYNNIDFEYFNLIGGLDIFKNQYTLPIGYVVNDLSEWNYSDANVFKVQNNFCEEAVEGNSIFYTVYPEFEVQGYNCDATLDFNSISYTRTDTVGCRVSVSFVLDEYTDLYANLTGSNIKKIRVWVNDTEIAYDRFQGQNYHVGRYPENTKIMLEYELNDNAVDSGTLQVNLAGFNYEEFYKVYDKLNRYGIEVTEYTDNTLKGTLNTEMDGTVFTSIPYNEGWTLYVDGEEVTFSKEAGAFIGFPIEAGEHTIDMKYYPVGMKKGIIITASGWLIFAVICLYRGRRRDEQKNQ